MRATPKTRFDAVVNHLAAPQAERLKQAFASLTPTQQSKVAAKLDTSQSKFTAEAVVAALPAKVASSVRADVEALAKQQGRGLDGLMGADPLEQRVHGLGARTFVADDLLGVMAEARATDRSSSHLRAEIARAARGGLDRVLAAAKPLSTPDLLSVHAEEAGKLLEIICSSEGRRDAPADVALGVTQLANRVIDLQIGELSRLARSAASDPAGAIRESESVGVSLQIDLGRLRRYGLGARSVDVEALVFAVKQAAVDSFRR